MNENTTNLVTDDEDFAPLDDEEVKVARRVLGRSPNRLEREVLHALWSEHCSYKSSRHLLRRLPREGAGVVVGRGANAGVVDIGNGIGVAFKMESHNHPSFIEPFHGAATGVGGILRDVFAMGARPFAAVNLFRFGSVDDERTRALLDGVVRGVAFYGNSFGVPTLLSNVAFYSEYSQNILVNVCAFGLVQHDEILTSVVSSSDAAIVYLGAATGRDGMHGATMSSSGFLAGSPLPSAKNVQTGDPLVGKGVLETVLEAQRRRLLRGCHDLGAAGVTSAIFEISKQNHRGAVVNVDAIPCVEASLTIVERMLSETQERMLVVVDPKKVAAVSAVAEMYGIECAVVGQLTTSRCVELKHAGRLVGELPCGIADAGPVFDNDGESSRGPPPFTAVVSFADAQTDPNFFSERAILEQFDRHVGCRSLRDGTTSIAAVVDVPEAYTAIAIAVCGPKRTPTTGFGGAYDEAVRQVVDGVLSLACVGAAPLALTDCLNFGSPRESRVRGDMSSTIDGLSDACHVFQVPVVSGNVSLNNQTGNRSIPATPAVVILGKCPIAGPFPPRFASANDAVLWVHPTTTTDSLACAAVQRLAERLRALVGEHMIAGATIVDELGMKTALLSFCRTTGLDQPIECDARYERLPAVLLAVPRVHVAAVTDRLSDGTRMVVEVLGFATSSALCDASGTFEHKTSSQIYDERLRKLFDGT